MFPKGNAYWKKHFLRSAFFWLLQLDLNHVRLQHQFICAVKRLISLCCGTTSAPPSSSTGRGRCSVPCVRKRLAGSLVQSYLKNKVKDHPYGWSLTLKEPNGLDDNYETISNVIFGVFSWTSWNTSRISFIYGCHSFDIFSVPNIMTHNSQLQ